MSVGKINRRLFFQSQTRTQDGGGSQAVTHSDSFSTFGHISPKTGAEKLFGDQLEENITHVITVRYRKDITHKMRIQYRPTSSITRTFNIKRVINQNDKSKYLEILCIEGVAT